MNAQDVLNHLHSRIPLTMGSRVSLFSIRDRILEALKDLIGQSGLTADTVVAAAKKYFDQWTAGDDPNIPNWIETIGEAFVWWGIERAIRRMFANSPPDLSP